MAIRRAMALVVALVMSATFAVAQQAPKKDEKKRSKQENQEIEQLIKVIDAAAAGQPVASEIGIAIEPFHFLAAQNLTFVPFIMKLTNAPKTDLAMIVRVVAPEAAATDPKAKPKGRPVYPWEDAHFISAAELQGDPATLYRILQAAPGTYDVYVAIKERLPEKAPRNQVAKVGWVKTSVELPNFSNGEFATSSVLVTDKVNTLTAPMTPEERRTRPFVFGAQEFVPAPDLDFAKTEEFNVLFQVYNSGLEATGKPNVTIEYEFHRMEDGAEKFFNRTQPQAYNASNLPPQFDPAIHPIPGSVAIPLTSFPAGSYRLAIKVTDKVANKVLTRDVKFVVKG